MPRHDRPTRTGHFVLWLAGLTLSFAGASLAADYTLLATPTTVAWGYYSGLAKPVMTVHSGDTVRMQTLSTCGSPERMVGGGVKPEEIPAYTARIYDEVKDIGPG